MSKIKPELAEILGLLCAEGCHVIQFSSFWGTDKGKPRYYKNHKSERIEFFNNDLKLLERLQILLSIEFNYYPKITKDNKINICKRTVIRKVIKSTKLGHLSWKVPKSIKISSKKVKISFIRGFFDGDGSASTSIRFFSTNRIGLIQISKLLNDLKLLHTFEGPHFREGKKPSYVIQVSRREEERFLNIIQPISKVPGMRG